MTYYTLITGASSGIGLELALSAAREKRNLIMVARDKKGLDSAREQILKNLTGRKPKIEILAVDLSKTTSPEQVFNFCRKKQFGVSELINNAGFGDYGEFYKSDLKRQIAMINLNISAVTELTHLFLPDMVKNKSGKIMNVGSVASFLPGPLMSVYFASKNYVLRFSEALAEELNGSGVTVTCLCPPSTKTNFGRSAHVSETHSTANPKLTAQEVANFGWYHMQNGSRVAIYGLVNRVMLQSAKFIPRSLVTKLVKKIQK